MDDNEKSLIRHLKLLILALTLGVLFISPQLQAKTITPVDAEESLKDTRTNFPEFLYSVFQNNDRFRPAYDLQRFFWSKYFGYKSQYYFLTNAFLLGLTLYFIWLIIDVKKTFDYFLSTFLILAPPIVVDNYWRLGTAEPLYALALVATLFFLKIKKYLLMIVSALILLISKESAVFLMPIFILYLIFNRNQKVALSLLIVFSVYFFFLLPRFFDVEQTRYMSQFVFEGGRNLGVLIEYLTKDWLIFLLMIITSILFLKSRVKDVEAKKFDLLIIVLSWASVVPLLLKWQHYYLLPTLVLVCMSLLRLTNSNFLASRKKFAIILLVLFILSGWFSETLEITKHWHIKQVGDSVVSEYLLSERTKEKVNKYYFSNPSLHYTVGAWIILSDFGRLPINFFPEPETVWKSYEIWGEDGVTKLAETSQSRFFEQPLRATLITNSCDITKSQNLSVIPLCKYSWFFKDTICNWCEVRELE